MGCVQGKGTVESPKRDLEKLKAANGYVRRENVVKSSGSRQLSSRDLIKPLRSSGGDVKDATVNAGGGGGGDMKISREIEKKTNGGGNVSQKIPIKKIAADELIDGWPVWLVENVSKDALSGFVPKSADSYDKLAKVGKGTYSNVYKARDKSTGKIVALKKVRFDTSEPQSVKFMAREIIMLKELDHPNIIKIEGIATSRMQCSLYLVFDFMQSDLTKVITSPDGRLTEPQVKSYMQQLLAGLEHCHEKGILHRDIKPSNLLIDNNGLLKIADFGLANSYKDKLKLTSRVVTLWYRAPELLLGSTDYGVGIDLWSAGCILAEMLVGRPIMPGRNEIEQLHQIFKLCGAPPEDYWKKVKPTFRPPHPYKPDFKERFPFFSESTIVLLGRLLALDPAYRGTATSALQTEFFTTYPLACEVSGLPAMSTEEDEPIKSMEKRGSGLSNTKQRSHKHSRKVSFSGHIVDAAIAKELQIIAMSSQSIETSNSSISTSSTTKPSSLEGIPPHTPTPAFRDHQDRSKTEAHPNALKNIQNYPLLLASLTEAAHHLEESKSSLYRRSYSNIDFRNLDLEKISKLFGVDDN